MPKWTGKTYSDLAEYALTLHEAAQASEADKKAAKQELESWNAAK